MNTTHFMLHNNNPLTRRLFVVYCFQVCSCSEHIKRCTDLILIANHLLMDLVQHFTTPCSDHRFNTAHLILHINHTLTRRLTPPF